jgi:hypothetical protein
MELTLKSHFLDDWAKPGAEELTIADKPIESSTSSGVCTEVVDPIPFDLLDRNDSTDEDKL